MIPVFVKKNLVLFVILAVAFFLRIYKMPSLMAFGGDVARDFLAARDMTLKGEIPLLGSPTSVPWLHQGAFFTYLLGVVLWLGKYNPLAGGYFVGVLGVLGVLGVYALGKKLFSKEVGLLSALFYATSPMVILFDRYPYHQSVISLFTIIFVFSLWKIRRNIRYMILSFFLFGLLIQLELSNLVLLPVLLIWLFRYREQVRFKLLALSGFVFLFTWLPKIIYDFSHGFTQTLGLIAWVAHRLPPASWFLHEPVVKMPILARIDTLGTYFSRLVFWPSSLLSGFLFLGMLGVLVILGGLSEREKESRQLLLLWIFFPILGFLVQGSPSESYMPVVFAIPAFLLGGYAFSLARRRLARLVALLVVVLGIFNGYWVVKHDYFLLTGTKSDEKKSYNFGQSYALNMQIANFIVQDANKEKYNLIPLGNFAHYDSSDDSLFYLTWYLGNEPSEEREKLQFFVYNREEGITVKKAEKIKEFHYLTIAETIR